MGAGGTVGNSITYTRWFAVNHGWQIAIWVKSTVGSHYATLLKTASDYLGALSKTVTSFIEDEFVTPNLFPALSERTRFAKNTIADILAFQARLNSLRQIITELNDNVIGPRLNLLMRADSAAGAGTAAAVAAARASARAARSLSTTACTAVAAAASVSSTLARLPPVAGAVALGNLRCARYPV